MCVSSIYLCKGKFISLHMLYHTELVLRVASYSEKEYCNS